MGRTGLVELNWPAQFGPEAAVPRGGPCARRWILVLPSRNPRFNAMERESVTITIRELDELVRTLDRPKSRLYPFDEVHPVLTAEDGLIGPPRIMGESLARKVARAAVVGLFMGVAAACGVVLA